MWILRASDPSEAEELTFRIRSDGAKTLGRDPHADFMVDRTLVSRLHCRLIQTDDRLEVEDLDSTNGTFVNGQRVKRKVLASGDTLRVGRAELTASEESAGS